MILGAAILGAVLLFTVLVTGGLATTAVTLNAPDSIVFHALLHRRAGEMAGAGALAAFVWIAVRLPELRKAGLALSAGVVAQGLLGVLPLGGGLAGLVHSVLAHLLVAGSIGLAVGASGAWSREPQIIADYGWPSLRSLSISLPALVTVQIALGAAFRHGMLGLMPHVIGAILISMFILMVGSFVLQQCKTHQTLSFAGRTMMVVTFVQVFLGIAVFTVRSLPKQEVAAVLAIASAHVATGALLLGASIVLGMHIRRNVSPKAASKA